MGHKSMEIFLDIFSCKTIVRKEAENAMEKSHVESISPPWLRESVLTKKLLHDNAANGKARFYKYDLWHSFHLGVGKHWCGAFLMLLQKKVHAATVEERFSVLNRAYTEYCSRKKIPKIITKLDVHTCGGPGTHEPIATWSKAAVTSNMCLFLQDFCSKNNSLITGDSRLEYLEACLHAHGM